MPGAKCERCGGNVDIGIFLGSAPGVCPHCGNRQLILLFPSVLGSHRKGDKAEAVIEEGQSSCLNHPDKAASAVCDECGAYLCSLCDLELEGRHLCSKCLKNSKGKIKSLTAHSILYDEIALTISIISCLVVYFIVFSAPFVIVFSIIKWNKVSVPYKRRTKARFVIAMSIASIQIVGMACLIAALIAGVSF